MDFRKVTPDTINYTENKTIELTDCTRACLISLLYNHIAIQYKTKLLPIVCPDVCLDL
jgi:hypothetical protein